MMANLKSDILKLKQDISILKRDKRIVTGKISRLQEKLAKLESLTVNQLDIFKDGKEE